MIDRKKRLKTSHGTKSGGVDNVVRGETETLWLSGTGCKADGIFVRRKRSNPVCFVGTRHRGGSMPDLDRVENLSCGRRVVFV